MSRTKPRPKSEAMAALGARLRIEREAQRVTLEQLAQATGLAVNTVRWHEVGSRMLRADDIAAAAKILHLDPQALMVPHYADRETDKAIRVALGRRMSSQRAIAGKRQHEAIKGTGVAMHELAAHEAGVRSLRADQLVAMAEALGCEPSMLIAFEVVDIG